MSSEVTAASRTVASAESRSGCMAPPQPSRASNGLRVCMARSYMWWCVRARALVRSADMVHGRGPGWM